MIKIPILLNHDHTIIPIGWLKEINDKLCFKLDPPVTRDELFSIFGDAGIFVTKMNDTLLISEGEILEFSLSFSRMPPAVKKEEEK